MVPTPTPIMAGNWKMNHGPTETAGFFERFLPRYEASSRRTVVFFPPALSLAAARTALASRPDVGLGVQDVYWEESGAYTGALSAGMAADAGARAVLVGHSERRHLFGESVEDTVRKTQAVIGAGLVAVLCVGEQIGERRAGAAAEVVAAQLEPVLRAVAEVPAGHLWVAYEPVWAIGTGESATPADAEEMHARVRDLLRSRLGEAAAAVPILYGGSVKAENAADLLATPGVDGLLVGGSSLDPEGFALVCAAGA